MVLADERFDVLNAPVGVLIRGHEPIVERV
jgi:hypothetical protein